MVPPDPPAKTHLLTPMHGRQKLASADLHSAAYRITYGVPTTPDWLATNDMCAVSCERHRVTGCLV